MLDFIRQRSEITRVTETEPSKRNVISRGWIGLAIVPFVTYRDILRLYSIYFCKTLSYFSLMNIPSISERKTSSLIPGLHFWVF